MTSQITVASTAFFATYMQFETPFHGLFFDLNLFMSVFHRCVFRAQRLLNFCDL